ncbi:2-oxoglutarate dehydrogenase, E2 component, dihydrolipoamide succinyltransferase [Nocardia africana]|uniref:Dihydrolipoamide acetyltransferase component of pyruvate dehydrogenase complex n=1 Tax=Nocardia africana TaxID=134964 RepID=A0A378WQL7_9NOCA|nr:2-oxoglutarate dehydrogenase, E2 component, dihydrolipoamide succinyltransferase [Nocardia africana]MCC3314813.1 2-oxoglutarate dehydrogenase, E2 component, dihydrolipoamide succinyltransferase [Nocardia africana]SUA42905.1 Dihydrolipoyllysine-residue succinyltransferase component of 2-oxoglutarate dehydrogenase complex [Nocardia africana]
MAFSVQMPALGESVTEGTVTRWLKQEGDTVEVDEPLLEVSTDKVDTEIPSPAAGVLTKIVAQEDDVVEVGGELGVIGDADEASAPAPAPAQEAPAQQAPAESAPAQEAPAQQAPAQEAPAQQPAPAAQSGGAADGTPVKMPELGESVTEGTVTRWLKQVGDQVEVDEPLLEVSTDKVDTEIPSPVAGTLLEISANEDDVVSVGGQLGVIGSGSPAAAQSAPAPAPAPAQQQAPAQEAPAQQAPAQQAPAQQAPQQQAPAQQAPQQAPAKQEAPAQQAPAQPAPAQAAPSAPSGNGESPYVTPLVRKLAQENNVDLSTLKGSGVGGRIRKQDVLAAAEANKAPAAPQPAAAPATAAAPAAPSAPAGARPQLQALRGTVQKANRIRQITATKTRESLQTTAQLTQTHEVDVTKIAALRAKAKSAFADREGVNLTFLPFFAKAAVEALGVHPNVNASYNEETKEITYHSSVHLGIAVDTEQGLLSPVIHNASDLSLAGLARAIADIANRARTGGLKPDELAGGTFTITNIGSQGALFDTPILVPPQAAMLGTGAIVKRPMVISDNGSEFIGIRSMCYLPLTYDHRLIDGADAGRFLTTIRHRLEEAAFEADLGL